MVFPKNFYSTLDFRRKLVHLILGILLVNFLNNTNYEMGFVLLFLLIFGVILSLIVKHYRPYFILKLLIHFDKPSDVETFPGKGAIYYVAGSLAAVLLFEKSIASAAIMILAVSDSTAHLVGRYYGRYKLVLNEKKLLEGTLAGVIFGTVAAAFYVQWQIAFFGAISAMMAEAVELQYLHMDDNFYIPLIAGGVMSLLINLA